MGDLGGRFDGLDPQLTHSRLVAGDEYATTLKHKQPLVARHNSPGCNDP
ncbi:MAG TPA: hypothetical protein VFE18_11755 [Phenylobacterium sp.]|jgi:hypothetical protein|nr:hypothetical protein [Phenylobacterium sp.]